MKVNQFFLKAPALGGLTQILIVSVGLYLGSAMLIPLAIAMTFFFLMSPIVNRWAEPRQYVRRWLLASGIMLSVGAVLFTGLYYLASPSYSFFQQASRNIDKIERRVVKVKGGFQAVDSAKEVMQDLNGGGAIEKSAAPISQQMVGNELFSIVQGIIKNFALIGFLLIFMLVYGDDLILRSWKWLSGTQNISVPQLIDQVKTATGKYLLTVTAINFILGVCIGSSLYLLGFENPILWGVLGMMLNFIPYFGSAIGAILAAIFGVAAFGLNLQGLMPGLIYFACSTVEGQIITPVLLGSSFRMNPLIILIAMLYWSFLWGVVGMFLAVPFLIVAKLVMECPRVDDKECSVDPYRVKVLAGR